MRRASIEGMFLVNYSGQARQGMSCTMLPPDELVRSAPVAEPSGGSIVPSAIFAKVDERPFRLHPVTLEDRQVPPSAGVRETRERKHRVLRSVYSNALVFQPRHQADIRIGVGPQRSAELYPYDVEEVSRTWTIVQGG